MDCKLKEEATQSQWRSMERSLERSEVLWLRLRTTSDHKLLFRALGNCLLPGLDRHTFGVIFLLVVSLTPLTSLVALITACLWTAGCGSRWSLQGSYDLWLPMWDWLWSMNSLTTSAPGMPWIIAPFPHIWGKMWLLAAWIFYHWIGVMWLISISVRSSMFGLHTSPSGDCYWIWNLGLRKLVAMVLSFVSHPIFNENRVGG